MRQLIVDQFKIIGTCWIVYFFSSQSDTGLLEVVTGIEDLVQVTRGFQDVPQIIKCSCGFARSTMTTRLCFSEAEIVVITGILNYVQSKTQDIFVGLGHWAPERGFSLPSHLHWFNLSSVHAITLKQWPLHSPPSWPWLWPAAMDNISHTLLLSHLAALCWFQSDLGDRQQY